MVGQHPVNCDLEHLGGVWFNTRSSGNQYDMAPMNNHRVIGFDDFKMRETPPSTNGARLEPTQLILLKCVNLNGLKQNPSRLTVLPNKQDVYQTTLLVNLYQDNAHLTKSWTELNNLREKMFMVVLLCFFIPIHGKWYCFIHKFAASFYKIFNCKFNIKNNMEKQKPYLFIKYIRFNFFFSLFFFFQLFYLI